MKYSKIEYIRGVASFRVIILNIVAFLPFQYEINRMPQLKVPLVFPITDLTQKLLGYHSVRFIDWEPDVYLSYSVGSSQTASVRKGMKVPVSYSILVYKFSSKPITLTIEVD